MQIISILDWFWCISLPDFFLVFTQPRTLYLTAFLSLPPGVIEYMTHDKALLHSSHLFEIWKEVLRSYLAKNETHFQKCVMFSCFTDKWIGLQLRRGSYSALACHQTQSNIIKGQIGNTFASLQPRWLRLQIEMLQRLRHL